MFERISSEKVDSSGGILYFLTFSKARLKRPESSSYWFFWKSLIKYTGKKSDHKEGFLGQEGFVWAVCFWRKKAILFPLLKGSWWKKHKEWLGKKKTKVFKLQVETIYFLIKLMLLCVKSRVQIAGSYTLGAMIFYLTPSKTCKHRVE